MPHPVIVSAIGPKINQRITVNIPFKQRENIFIPNISYVSPFFTSITALANFSNAYLLESISVYTLPKLCARSYDVATPRSLPHSDISVIIIYFVLIDFFLAL